MDSLVLNINEDTQDVTIAFTPQQLQPIQYGVVLSAVVVHIARCFLETNPAATEGDVINTILTGLQYGLAQSSNVTQPTSQH